MSFLQHDSGDHELSPSFWETGEEPLGPPRDSWLRGAVPIRQIPATPMHEADDTVQSIHSKQSSQQTRSTPKTSPAGKTVPQQLKPTPLPQRPTAADPDDALREMVERRRRQLETTRREQQKQEGEVIQAQVVFFNAAEARKLPNSRYRNALNAAADPNSDAGSPQSIQLVRMQGVECCVVHFDFSQHVLLILDTPCKRHVKIN